MNAEIILERLKDVLDYMSMLDEKRGTLNVSIIDNETLYAGTFFIDKECETDFRLAEHYINDRLGDLKMFQQGYVEVVNSPFVSEYQKADLAIRVLNVLENSDNFCNGRAVNNDWIHSNYFDNKSGFDEDLIFNNGEQFYYIPNIEDWRTAKFAKCDNDVFFYRYSYYIIHIAKEIANTINDNVPKYYITSKNISEYKENHKNRQDKICKELLLKIENWTKYAFACDNISNNDIMTIAREVNYFFENNQLSSNIVRISNLDTLKPSDICTAFWGMWELWSRERKNTGKMQKKQEEFIPLIRHIFNKHLFSTHIKKDLLPNETLLKYMAECRGSNITRKMFREFVDR